jgi:hypothetical protein
MTTINLTTRKNDKMQLDGNILSGDTFAIKGYIKSYMDGKWLPEAKAWQVNVEKTMKLIEGASCIGLRIDDTAPVTETTSNKNWFVNTKYGRELSEDC